MFRFCKRFSSFLLLAALAMPVATFARDDHDHDHDRDHRYYDRAHKDYHHWDEHESAAYRHWMEAERHHRYVEFDHLSKADQQRYWVWRHDHSDWH